MDLKQSIRRQIINSVKGAAGIPRQNIAAISKLAAETNLSPIPASVPAPQPAQSPSVVAMPQQSGLSYQTPGEKGQVHVAQPKSMVNQNFA